MSNNLKATLEVGLIGICPHMCLAICPQNKLIQAYKEKYPHIKFNIKNGNLGFIDLKDYDTILNKVPSDVCIDIAAAVEGTFHPQFADILERTYSTHKQIRLYTTLGGLKREDIDRISKIPLLVCVLHFPEENNLIMKLDVTDEYISIVDEFTSKVRVNAEVYGPIHPKLAKFRSKFEIAERTRTTQHITSRGGLIQNSNLVQLDPVPKKDGRIRCLPILQKHGTRYNHNTMNYIGDIYLCCCSQFNLSHKLGNLLDINTTYESLFNSDEYKSIVRAQDDADYRNSIDCMCSRCELAIPKDIWWHKVSSDPPDLL